MFLGAKIPVLGMLVLLLHSKLEQVLSNRFQHTAVTPLQYSYALSDSGLLHFNISESLITKKKTYKVTDPVVNFSVLTTIQ
jgi:hypothetical protein